MRSSTIIASVLAFAASALAQDATPGYAVVSAPGQGEVVPAGKTFTIKWSAGKFSGPATISLLAGATPQTLQVTDAIANDVEVKTGSFSWKVDCSLGEDKTYGLKIADKASGGATFQYSFPFEIKGPSCDSTTSTSSVSASASETGYVTISLSATTLSATTSGYPTTSITASTSASAYPTKGSNSTTSATVSYTTSSYSNSTVTTVKSSSKATSTASTLTTYSTPVVIVTETSAATGSASSTPATSTTASSPVPTAGAARAGAGLALGLIAAALAL
ncbi:Ser-Thr-rich glycosyl-phosphatidyl-inositol-anchored membrane family-domain-containing protein [Xylaria sp. FL0933]|nr:Ser-Thr-rich glycosyl-phosphatidyl-inositol-anchored membrane family-domain-containing protein [Xylaria sp. FL0933]